MGHSDGSVDCNIAGRHNIGCGITYPRSISCGSAGNGIVHHSRRTNYSSVGRRIIKQDSSGGCEIVSRGKLRYGIIGRGSVSRSVIGQGSIDCRIVNRGSSRHGIVGRGSLRYGKSSHTIVGRVVNRSVVGRGSMYSGLIGHGIIAEV